MAWEHEIKYAVFICVTKNSVLCRVIKVLNSSFILIFQDQKKFILYPVSLSLSLSQNNPVWGSCHSGEIYLRKLIRVKVALLDAARFNKKANYIKQASGRYKWGRFCSVLNNTFSPSESREIIHL